LSLKCLYPLTACISVLLQPVPLLCEVFDLTQALLKQAFQISQPAFSNLLLRDRGRGMLTILSRLLPGRILDRQHFYPFFHKDLTLVA
jgi:hypothetical protein